MRRALLVIDLLNDFGPGGALEVPGAAEIVEPINRLQADGGYETIVLVQDFHPSDHGSFASNHPGIEVGQTFDLDGLSQVAWPDHCVQGTSGADFVPGLDTNRASIVIRKGTDPAVDSYSAFADNGHRRVTGLTGYLRGLEIEGCDVVGVATDFCVKFTALDARGNGFATRFVREGCRAVDLTPGDGESAVEAMEAAGVEIVSMTGLLT